MSALTVVNGSDYASGLGKAGHAIHRHYVVTGSLASTVPWQTRR
jgi:hypothetical protein